MALTAVTDPGLDLTGGRATTDLLSLDEILAEILLNDTDFLSRIPMGPAVTQTTHFWVEDSENSHLVTIDDTGGVTIVLDAVETTLLVVPAAPQLRVGMLLYNQDQQGAGITDPEVIQIVSVTTPGSEFEVERGYGGTVAVATHADDDTFVITASPKLESDEGSSDISLARTNGTNFTMIFERGVKVSGSVLPLPQAGVQSEWTHQISRRLLEIRKDMANAIIMSRANTAASGGSSVETRTKKGLNQFITDAGTTLLQRDAGGVNLGLDTEVNPLTTELWNQGAFNQGNPALLLVNSFNQTRISTFDDTKQRFLEDSRLAGRFVQFIMTDIGIQLEVVVDRFTPTDKVYEVDLGRVSLHTLMGREMRVEELAKTGDFRRAQLITETTLKVENADRAHGFIFNTTTA